jgi:hypothetical protein
MPFSINLPYKRLLMFHVPNLTSIFQSSGGAKNPSNFEAV